MWQSFYEQYSLLARSQWLEPIGSEDCVEIR
jgi:hypothetical protein